jgi:hypothetical protein
VPAAARRVRKGRVDSRDFEPGRGVRAHSGGVGAFVDRDLFDHEQVSQRRMDARRARLASSLLDHEVD